MLYVKDNRACFNIELCNRIKPSWCIHILSEWWYIAASDSAELLWFANGLKKIMKINIFKKNNTIQTNYKSSTTLLKHSHIKLGWFKVILKELFFFFKLKLCLPCFFCFCLFFWRSYYCKSKCCVGIILFVSALRVKGCLKSS